VRQLASKDENTEVEEATALDAVNQVTHDEDMADRKFYV
jgi:hypothetical protein